jgi:hypothetical protein
VRRARVGQQAKHVLQVRVDVVVERQPAVDDGAQVRAHLAELALEPAQRLQLGRHVGRERRRRRVLDVAQQVLGADLLGFSTAHLGRHRRKHAARLFGAVLAHLVDRAVGRERQADLLGLDLADDEHRRLAVGAHERVDVDVGLAQARAGAVPAHDALARC